MIFTIATSVAGLALVVATTYQVVTQALAMRDESRGRREHQRVRRQLLEARLDGLRDPTEEEAADTAWQGYRKFVLKEKVYEGIEETAESLSEDLGKRTAFDLLLDRPVLKAIDGDERHLLIKEDVLIGRGQDCTIVLQDPTVSSHHARIYQENGGWRVEDLGSTNGTTVDERPVTDAVPVDDRVEVAFGSEKFELVIPERSADADAGDESESESLSSCDVCSFYLAPHDRKPLPAFKPGQHLTFRLQIPGEQKPVVRCYSLSDCYDPSTYRVTIKRLGPPPDEPDAPPGKASTHFHDMKPGDIVDVKAPSGHFYLDLAETSPVVLIGGGIGITPMLAMLNGITSRGSHRETWLFYGVRNRREHIMKEHLDQLAASHDNVHIRACYSRPDPEDQEGRDYQRDGRVDIEYLRETLPSNNYDFYVCGPPPMMEAITTGLADWGVPDEHVHFESFGPSTVKKVGKSDGDADLEVTFDQSGKEIHWEPDRGSLLDFAEAHGIVIDSGCRAGNCGTCIAAVKSGTVDYLTEPGLPVEDGSCLTCIAVPKGGDVVLDA